MDIIGIGKDECIVCTMTLEEIERVAGVHGKPHISGRFKAGKEINISKVYDKVSKINEKQSELIQAANDVISAANDIKSNIVLTDEE